MEPKENSLEIPKNRLVEGIYLEIRKACFEFRREFVSNSSFTASFITFPKLPIEKNDCHDYSKIKSELEKLQLAFDNYRTSFECGAKEVITDNLRSQYLVFRMSLDQYEKIINEKILILNILQEIAMITKESETIFNNSYINKQDKPKFTGFFNEIKKSLHPYSRNLDYQEPLIDNLVDYTNKIIEFISNINFPSTETMTLEGQINYLKSGLLPNQTQAIGSMGQQNESKLYTINDLGKSLSQIREDMSSLRQSLEV